MDGGMTNDPHKSAKKKKKRMSSPKWCVLLYIPTLREINVYCVHILDKCVMAVALCIYAHVGGEHPSGRQRNIYSAIRASSMHLYNMTALL